MSSIHDAFLNSCQEKCPYLLEMAASDSLLLPDSSTLFPSFASMEASACLLADILKSFPPDTACPYFHHLSYTKMWLIYARCSWDPVHVYDTMLRKNIGKKCASLYLEMAKYYVLQEQR